MKERDMNRWGRFCIFVIYCLGGVVGIDFIKFWGLVVEFCFMLFIYGCKLSILLLRFS